jgi:methylaspartate ammonia-lyase
VCCSSQAGDGGVAARAGGCLYCALKDVILFIAAGCAEREVRRRRCSSVSEVAME